MVWPTPCTVWRYPDYVPNAEAVYVRQASGLEAIVMVTEEYQSVFGKGNGAGSFEYCDLIGLPLTVDTRDARPTRAQTGSVSACASAKEVAGHRNWPLPCSH